MKPEAQQTAIAEACKWVLEPAGKDSFGVFYAAFWRHPDFQGVHSVPNFLTDLNAIHAAEREVMLPDIALRNQYAANLKSVDMPATDFFYLHATAAQRAEAFLKTVGKWVEE